MDYKNGKWAEKIINIQHNDGSWGYFHSLSNPTPQQPMTTEQALRRLKIFVENHKRASNVANQWKEIINEPPRGKPRGIIKRCLFW